MKYENVVKMGFAAMFIWMMFLFGWIINIATLVITATGLESFSDAPVSLWVQLVGVVAVPLGCVMGWVSLFL